MRRRKNQQTEREELCRSIGHRVGFVGLPGCRYHGCRYCGKTMLDITLEASKRRDQVDEHYLELLRQQDEA